MTDEPPVEFGIRTAVFPIGSCSPFLAGLRAIAAARSTRIICFNADLMAGRAHAEAAIRRALRAVKGGSAISSSLEMEALISASGSRQCSAAGRFGVHEGENRAYVCLCPPVPGAWQDLAGIMEFVDDDWETIDEEKRKRLSEAFGITPAEIRTAGQERFRELVLERVALLEVYR
ncbi:MAG TPA: KEOPS complex subunit Cgi121 [Methanomicrobiales archaeon]|nr:KEOPS complex subunit Cgi121 [Methanomicrobiales archaeon]